MTTEQQAEALTLAKRLVALLGDVAEPPPPPPVARVAFSNLGPGDTYNNSSARRVTDPRSVFGVNAAEYAVCFEINETGTLDRIELPLSRLAISGKSPRAFALRTSLNGPSGDLCERWEIVPDKSERLTTLESEIISTLTPGIYWLVAQTIYDGDALDSWWLSLSDNSGVMYRKPAGQWQHLDGYTPAFRVWVK